MAQEWRKKQDEAAFRDQINLAIVQNMLQEKFPEAKFQRQDDKQEYVKRADHQLLVMQQPDKGKAPLYFRQHKDGGFSIDMEVVPEQEKDKPRKKEPSQAEMKEAITTLAGIIFKTKELQEQSKGTFYLKSISPANMKEAAIRALLIDDEKLNDKDKGYTPEQCRRFDYVKFGDKTYELDENNKVVERDTPTQQTAHALFQHPSQAGSPGGADGAMSPGLDGNGASSRW